MRITGHKVTCTQGYRIDEQGTGYSLQPWGQNTPYFEGYSEPVEVDLNDRYEVADSAMGEPMIYPKDGSERGRDLGEAITMGIAKVV